MIRACLVALLLALALPAIAQDAPTITITGSTTVSWEAPTQYTDGSALPASDLAGYKIYASPVPGSAPGMTYVEVLEITNAGETSTSFSMPIADPNDPTFYFVMTAFTTDGDESGFSNEVGKSLEVTIEDNRVPAPPTLQSVDFDLTCTTDVEGVTCVVTVRDAP